MYKPETDFEQLARSIVKHKWFIALFFAVISLGLTTLGFFAQKQYSSYSTLLIERSSILTPLLDGAAVQKENEPGKVAKEAIYSRRTLTQLGQELGLLDGEVDTSAEESTLNMLKNKIAVSLDADRYLKVEFIENTAEKAFQGADVLTKIFIGQKQGGKSRESEGAYNFIDNQVKGYHKKLLEAEDRLKGFRAKKLASGTTSEEAITQRVERLQEMLDQASLDLKEAYIQKSSLQRQLKGEVRTSVSLSRQSQYVNRIQQLKDELARLRLNYQESYPDIVDLKHQIADQEKLMRQEKRNSEVRGSIGLDDSIRVNEVYQDMKLRLSNANTQVATLQVRVNEMKKNIANERKKGKQVSDVDAQQAELMRDYTVNKDIYEDLLRRREKARVSMDVESDASHSGITLYEPAFMPVTPVGLRFIHYIAVGLVMGLGLPLAALYLLQIVGTKVKSDQFLTANMKIPVLASVESIRNDIEMRIESGSRITITLFYFATFAAIALLGYYRLMGQV